MSPANDATADSSSGCPVQNQQAEACPVKHGVADASSSKPKTTHEVYNVYSQRIDPTNMCPSNPNQEPNDSQRFPLPTERVQSTIPKGGTDSTWLYPSEQMFFNALRRKGKGEDVHEAHVHSIVSIHNNMNEKAWAQIEAYERTCHPDSEPKLLKFCGRPDELSPLAKIKCLFGYGTPFDRHDWTILRSDATQVRYVIDYYFDDTKVQEDQIPELHSPSSVKSISIVARPAIDTVESLVDRLKFPFLTWYQHRGQSQVDPVSARATLHQTKTKTTTKTTTETETNKPVVATAPLTSQQVYETFAKIQQNCQKCFRQVKTCSNEWQCTQAATALQLCMGKIICPPESNAFEQLLNTSDDTEAIEAAFDVMNDKLDDFQTRSAVALREQAEREAFGSEDDHQEQQ